MTTAAKISFGAELWLGPAGGTLVKVAELLEVEPPKRTREFEDATTHDSPEGAAEVIPHGIYKLSDINATTHYIAGSAGDDAMIGYSEGTDMVDWKIVAKGTSDTEDLEGSGYVAEYGPNTFQIQGKQTASIRITPSGPMTQGATP